VRFSLKLTALVVGAMGLAALLAGPLKPLADRLPDAAAGTTYDFGRFFRRVAMLFAIAGGFFLWYRDRAASPRSTSLSERARWLAAGFLCGLISFALLLVALLGDGELRFVPSATGSWPVALAAALAAGLAVGLLEESLFRGWILGRLRSEHGIVAAIVVTSLLYGACHYFKAEVPVARGTDWSVGWVALVAHLRAVADPSHLLSLFGLVLVGLVLAAARIGSATLAFPIGVHAAWVFAFKSAPLALEPHTGIRWLYGPEGVVGRPAVWAALLAMAALAAAPALLRAPRTERVPR
jgi:membrane protease YdiL (CAAX protease family)